MPINDDSFSNLQAANDAPKLPIGTDDGREVKAADGHASLKMSIIHPTEDAADNSFFQNQSSFVFGSDSNDIHIMNKEGVDEYVDVVPSVCGSW